MAPRSDRITRARAQPTQPEFSAATIGALAHLYRGEVYRSTTIWHTRLDATTNWAVVTTGVALSLAFSSAAASPLPLALVGLLVAVFLYRPTRSCLQSSSRSRACISGMLFGRTSAIHE